MATPGFPLILRASADGDVKTLKKLLKTEDAKDVANSSNPIGQTGLHLAAMWGHRAVAELLLRAGANASPRNDFGVTPLHYAVQKGYYEVVVTLVENGADKNARDQKGVCPWELATEEDIRALCGPNLELHQAVKQYNVAKLQELVSGGADLAATDNDGRTALHLAVSAEGGTTGDESVQMLSTLLSVGNEPAKATMLAQSLCTRAKAGLTPFLLAAQNGSAQMVAMLLDTLSPEILRIVLEMRSHRVGEYTSGQWGKKDADGEVQEIDKEHQALLHIALERLEPDEDEDDEDDDMPVVELEPLSIDAERRQLLEEDKAEALKVVRLIIERGADVNARDGDGRAPIHQAVAYGRHDVARMLLDAHADPTMGCKSNGADNSTLHQATLKGDSEMIQVLLKAPAAASAPRVEADCAGQGGWTPLCLAARSNNLVATKALLAGGADPLRPMASGKNALDIAKVNKRVALVELLSGGQ